MSDGTLSKLLREHGVAAVPHGFRSSFRDWAAECTPYAREVTEVALAHRIPDAVEAAYFRSDLFEKRPELMQRWANYIVRPETAPKQFSTLSAALNLLEDNVWR